MLNVLIVDDQPNVVKGIVAGVDWFRLEIDIAYEAYSMQGAKEIIREKSIAILICDIEMPMGSGLELLKWVREEKYDMECIFLTSHQEFRYARQAIELGSADYLLQPIEYKELEKAISKAIEKVRRKENNEIYQKYGELWRKSSVKLKETVWRDIVVGMYSKSEFCQGRFQQEMERKYNISIDVGQKWGIILITLLNHEELEKIRNIDSISFIAENILNELCDFPESKIISYDSERWFILFSAQKCITVNEVAQKCMMMIGTCKRACGFELACYIGNCDVYLYQIHSVAQELLEMGGNNVEAYSGVFVKDVMKDVEESEFLQLQKKIGEWKQMIGDGQPECVLADVKEYLEECDKKSIVNLTFLQKFQLEFIMAYYEVTKESGRNKFRIFESKDNCAQLLTGVKSVKELLGFIQELLCGNTLDNVVKSKEQDIMELVKGYILDNLSGDLSRDEIASYVFLSPEYLSKQFKKYMGTTLTEYINDERMKLAKKLLSGTDLSIGMISLECGYNNFAYFSQVFRKQEKMTPNEYRRKMNKKTPF